MPLPDRVGSVWRVTDRDDPGVVNHLTEHDQMIGGLKDLVVAVVAGAESPDARYAVGDAPYLARPVFRSVRRMRVPIGSRRLDPHFGLGGQRWQLAVRWIRDQRGPVFKLPVHHPDPLQVHMARWGPRRAPLVVLGSDRRYATQEDHGDDRRDRKGVKVTHVCLQ